MSVPVKKTLPISNSKSSKSSIKSPSKSSVGISSPKTSKPSNSLTSSTASTASLSLISNNRINPRKPTLAKTPVGLIKTLVTPPTPSKVDSISSHLDRLLDIPRWSDKELAYYNMLKSKVETYAYKIKLMELDEDTKKIKANISEQDWFKDSVHGNIIFSYLDEMQIELYNYDEQAIDDSNTQFIVESNIIVRFPKSKFKLIVYFFVDPNNKIDVKGLAPNMKHIRRSQQSVTKFYAYVEDYNQINRSYIAYYDNEDLMGMNETIKLPELSQLYQIVKVGSAVSKLDLLRMFVEIMLFYDESEKINRCFIGVNYPLTIGHFLRDFSFASRDEDDDDEIQ